MKVLKHFISRYWPILILIGLELILFLTNYTKGTYLVGWDNLFPEFNFGLNIKRSLFAAWQEYRGLGYEDGMSHAANLPHYLFVYLFSFVFPQNMLRYIFMFAMHLLGGVGMFFLLRKMLKPVVHDTDSGQARMTLASLFGALFYQYSFATIQMFYLPFEVFITHFAFLPWLILFISNYLKTGSKKVLLGLGLFSFLATPQAHVPTVFIVYLMTLAIFLLFHILAHRNIRRVLVIVFVIFCTNAYWGLPFAYSTAHNAGIIADSKNNQMATTDIFLKNHEYGDLKSTALMRSFSLEFAQYNHETEQSELMMQSWIDHINSPVVEVISWGFFLIALSGGAVIVLKKKKELYPYVALFIFVFAIIGNDIPVISFVSYVLRTYVPLFANIFRFVFTKFFIVYAFSFAVLFALGFDILIRVFVSYVGKIGTYSSAILLGFALLIYTLPSFQGHFLHKQLRVDIPQEYFQVFDFFKQQPADGRIAILPAPWYWGWTQYKWGVIGSGFQWFGIEQPTLDLAFTPWSQINENFYWEISQALYTSDMQKFHQVLQKYDVSWLLIDDHIINPEKPAGALQLRELDEQGVSSGLVSRVASFNRIQIYKVNKSVAQDQFISLSQNVKNIGPAYAVNDSDPVVTDYPVYVTDPKKPYDLYYPFRSLFTGKQQKDLEFQVVESDNSFVFKAHIPPKLQGYTLNIPAFNSESLTGVNADTFESKQFYPSVYLDGTKIYEGSEINASNSASVRIAQLGEGTLEVVVPKVNGYYSYNSDPWNDFDQPKKSCNVFNTGLHEHELFTENGKKVLRLTSQNSSNCISFPFNHFSQRQGYLVMVESKNISGQGMFFSISNDQRRKTVQETYLEEKQNEVAQSYFVIPPMEPYSLGYTLNFDNISIGREKTVNELRKITINQIPYEFLSNLKLVRPQGFDLADKSANSVTTSNVAQVKHPNPAYYSINVSSNSSQDSVFALWQGYNRGWIALEKTNSFPYISTVEDHVLVNNWANGWNINESGTFYLIFWPQYLEYLGFVLLPLPFIFLLKKPGRNYWSGGV